MSTKSPLAQKQSALRFAMVWTGVNALLALAGMARIATAGLGSEPRITLGILAVVLLIVIVGLVRVQQLRREVDRLSGG